MPTLILNKSPQSLLTCLVCLYSHSLVNMLYLFLPFFLSLFLWNIKGERKTVDKKERNGLELNLQCWLNRVVAFVLSKRSDRSGFRTHLVIADQLPDWFFFSFSSSFPRMPVTIQFFWFFVFFAFPITYNSITTRPSGITKAFTTF